MSELDDPIDFATRRLCPDGACVGVVDARGVCRVCGAVGEAGERSVAVAAAVEGSADAGGADFVDGVHEDAGAFPDDRELCSDGACIGVLDARRVCKVCGAGA